MLTDTRDRSFFPLNYAEPCADTAGARCLYGAYACLNPSYATACGKTCRLC